MLLHKSVCSQKPMFHTDHVLYIEKPYKCTPPPNENFFLIMNEKKNNNNNNYYNNIFSDDRRLTN